MKKKKVGRPKLPEGVAKKRFNARLNDKQMKILFFGENTESQQKALENLLNRKEEVLKVTDNKFWQSIQDA